VIKRIHHVGVVVQSLQSAFTFWRDVLGLPLMREAELPDQGVRAALLACGPCEIELLELTASDTGVARFLASRGERLHHLCFESDDVGRELHRFLSTGVELIDARPRKGLAGPIAFVHPRSCFGILVEMATPIDHAPLLAAPLAVTTVHGMIEDVRAATSLYGDLFNLKLGLYHPDWSFAQLAIAGVTLHLSSATRTSGKPGLSGLRLMAADLGAFAARFDERGVAYRRGAFGLALGSAATHGVPLIIGQPQTQEVRA